MVTFKALDLEVRNLNKLVIEKNKDIKKLETELKSEREEKIDLINDHDKYRKENDEQRKLFDLEAAKLRIELDNMNQIVVSNQRGAEENLKVRIEEEKNLLINEYDQDREAYQKLLEEYHSLETHYEALQQEIGKQNRSNSHVRNNSDISSVTEDTVIPISDISEDHGYDSVRSFSSTMVRGKLQNIWNEGNSWRRTYFFF